MHIDSIHCAYKFEIAHNHHEGIRTFQHRLARLVVENIAKSGAMVSDYNHNL